jgi:hypothetical protein
VKQTSKILYQSTKMSSRDERIAKLEADIEALEAERRAATTPEERKDRLLDAITAKENRLTELMKAPGNYTARDSLLFMSPLTPFSYLFLALN